MSEYGRPCLACGHPADYHGVTFCQLIAGADTKRACDCGGYDNPEKMHRIEGVQFHPDLDEDELVMVPTEPTGGTE